MEGQIQKSWFSRNWGWVLGGGCLILILLVVFGIGAAFFGVTKILKNSDAYEYAIEEASNNEELIAIIGEPIEADGIMQGSINYSNGDTSVDITIPIKGPNGKASVSIKGEERNDIWYYEEFYITIKETNEQINLLDKSLEGL